MTVNRLSAEQRAILEVELRRAAGYRAVAAMAVIGLITMIGLNALPTGSDIGVIGLHTEPYAVEVPASLEEEFRHETIAAAPATGVYEEPELTVHHEVHG
ncbi:MAG: hypothetical protein ACXW2G_09885 [Burkholderiaceae bacterium]